MPPLPATILKTFTHPEPNSPEPTLNCHNQCGFRKNRSTTDQLVRLNTLIRDAFVNKEHAVSVFFDLEKAYETTRKYGILKDLHKKWT